MILWSGIRFFGQKGTRYKKGIYPDCNNTGLRQTVIIRPFSLVTCGNRYKDRRLSFRSYLAQILYSLIYSGVNGFEEIFPSTYDLSGSKVYFTVGDFHHYYVVTTDACA